MLLFKEQEFMYDCKKDKLMLIETSLDGVFDFSLSGRRLQTEFPDIVKQYRVQCNHGTPERGVPIYYNTRGYDLVLLPVIQNSYGFYKDQPHHILTALELGIDNLLEDASASNIASSYLANFDVYNGRIAGAIKVLSKVRASNLQWTIYKE